MGAYQTMSDSELKERKQKLDLQYTEMKKKKLKLDMSRGRPAANQLDLTMDMLKYELIADRIANENGVDTRNYGGVDGLPAVKKIFSELLDIDPANIIAGGNSSLNIMYDIIARALIFGVPGGSKPWGQQGKIKFLCPSPGYDRHFAITEEFGIEMVNIEMKDDGPDMDMVERLVSEDSSIKGIWCVPKYSNPTGITYSDEVVKRFAALKPKADDFRIFWDNAYCVHDLDENGDKLLNLLAECEKNGTEDMAYLFASTSKISFAGSGVAIVAASKNNIEKMKKQLFMQTIGPDKINHLRHAAFFKDASGVKEHMKKHAAIVKPKFDIVEKTLYNELGGLEIGSWSNPKGGYFISFSALSGCAKRIVALCKEAGVVLTPAGASYPYGIDPQDSNIRIAPTCPTVENLKQAAELFCLCVKIAGVEKILSQRG